MEGPEQREPWLGGPAGSSRGCWCHPAAAQGLPHPGRQAASADRLALPSPPQEGKRHSRFLGPLTLRAASWKACSAEPCPRGGHGPGRNGDPPFPSTPGLRGEGRESPPFPHPPYRRGPPHDCLQIRRGNPRGSGADPSSADSSTGLAPPHPSSDPKPCGQGGGSSRRGHWLPEEPQPQLPPGGEGTAHPCVHTRTHAP